MQTHVGINSPSQVVRVTVPFLLQGGKHLHEEILMTGF